jgi:CRISPR/Cas system Type II protein with McrA/HNH and RuvC-like nuclease domain
VKTWVFIFVKEMSVVKLLVVTICGNREFKRTINEFAKNLEMGGDIVFTPAIHRLPKNAKLTEEILERYKNIQKQKIEMADEVFVINKDGKVDDDVWEEVEYAKSLGKKLILPW